MRRIIEYGWLALILASDLQVIHASYNTLPAPPCDWWSRVPAPDMPPGLGNPQLAFLALSVALFAVTAVAIRSERNRPILFFALMIPLMTLAVLLLAVVDLEIHGGCVQLGGPELSRYNSLEALALLAIIGFPVNMIVGTVLALILWGAVWAARRADGKAV